MEKPLYYIVVATTIDGFIARTPGQISTDWTSKEDKEHLHKIEGEADVLLLASKSYGLAEERLKNFNSIVLTRKVEGIKEESKLLTYINTEKADLDGYVRKKGYKKVCVLGGRVAYNFVLEKDLLDEIYLTIEPVVFGEGIGFFNKEGPLKHFSLVSTKNLNDKGSLLLYYRKRKT
ncbi:MAG: dihydrofolate reductase family protein [Candidatus Diapherotrites archaeon]